MPRWLAGDVRISLLNASRAIAYEFRYGSDTRSFISLPGPGFDLRTRSGAFRSPPLPRTSADVRAREGLVHSTDMGVRFSAVWCRGPRGGTLGRSGDLRVTRETRVRLSLSNSLSTRARRPCRPTNQQSRYGGHRARAASKDATSARVLIVRQVVLINDVIDETGALGDTPEIGHEERVVEVTERFVMEALGVECG